MSLSDSIPKTIDVTNLLNEPLDGDIFTSINDSSFLLKYGSVYYPRITLSDINYYEDIHERIYDNTGFDAEVIYSVFGRTDYQFNSSVNKYELNGFSALVLCYSGSNYYLVFIEM